MKLDKHLLSLRNVCKKLKMIKIGNKTSQTNGMKQPSKRKLRNKVIKLVFILISQQPLVSLKVPKLLSRAE